MSKVMLVEDDNNLREIYEARLQAEGYTIVSAKDGEEALVVAKAEKPDLIISDVMMPKISGFEMLDILRNTEGMRDVKVIMLTALGQSDDQQRADKLGADRYLVKSQVTLEDIVNVAHQLLGEGGQAASATETATVPGGTPIENPAPAAEPVGQPVAVTVTPDEPTATPPADPVLQAVADDVAAADLPLATPGQAQPAAEDAAVESFVAGATSEATAPEPVGSAPETTTASADRALAEAADALAANGTNSNTKPAAPEADSDEKVITPLDEQPKPDLNTLLVAEEAKEQASPGEPADKPADRKIDPNSIAL